MKVEVHEGVDARERARLMRGLLWVAMRCLRRRRRVLMPLWECFVGKERRKPMVVDALGICMCVLVVMVVGS